MSIKTYITYEEHATHTFMQDSYHEQFSRTLWRKDQGRIIGQEKDVYNLTTHITIPT